MILVTPWHPVRAVGGKGGEEGHGGWVMPCCYLGVQTVPYDGFVYSVVLEADDDIEAHAILVRTGEVAGADAGEEFWGVTLGHGLRDGDFNVDVRVHAFYGDRLRLMEALEGLQEVNGQVSIEGIQRDERTGLACGFI